MTEFTSEFIAEQRNIIKQGTMTVQEMKVNNEIDLYINMMYRRAKTEHCEKYYPDALDEIERLQARIAELEQERKWIPVSEKPKKHGWHFVLYNDKINWERGFIGVNFYYLDKKEWSNNEDIEFYCEFQPDLP